MPVPYLVYYVVSGFICFINILAVMADKKRPSKERSRVQLNGWLQQLCDYVTRTTTRIYSN